MITETIRRVAHIARRNCHDYAFISGHFETRHQFTKCELEERIGLPDYYQVVAVYRDKNEPKNPGCIGVGV